jgi:dTDP-4-amino-4,6-dideoxy-D-glucose acyltransferase
LDYGKIASRKWLMDRFLCRKQLLEVGLAHVGENVSIDRSAILVNPEGISIGDHTRIDAFSLISGTGVGVKIGRNVHIAAGVYIYGRGGVTIEDFAGVSARCTIFSASDDFSGQVMTGPTVSEEFTSVTVAPIMIGRHVIIGAGSIILPGVSIGDCSAVGSLTLIKRDVSACTIVAGNPSRLIGARSQRLLDLEQRYLQSDRSR